MPSLQILMCHKPEIHMEVGEGCAGSVTGNPEPEEGDVCVWVDTVQPQLMFLLGFESSCCKL